MNNVEEETKTKTSKKIKSVIIIIIIICLVCFVKKITNNPETLALKHLRSKYNSTFDVALEKVTNKEGCSSSIEYTCLRMKKYKSYTFKVTDFDGYVFKMNCSDLHSFYCIEDYTLHLAELKIKEVLSDGFDYKFATKDSSLTIFIHDKNNDNRRFKKVYSDVVEKLHSNFRGPYGYYKIVYVKSKEEYDLLIEDEEGKKIIDGSIYDQIHDKIRDWKIESEIEKGNNIYFDFNELDYSIIIVVLGQNDFDNDSVWVYR